MSWLGAAAILAIVLTAAMLAAFVVLALFRELPLRFALRPLARLPFVSLKWTEAAAVNFVHRSRHCSGRAVVEASLR